MDEGNRTKLIVSLTAIGFISILGAVHINATNNFSISNKLGEGGFGPVYKGMQEGKEIAVKRLSSSSGQGIEEFKNETLLISSSNIKILLGSWAAVSKKMRNPARRPELDWGRRFNIIQDLKVSNILLDENMNPKISDFGLARIRSRDTESNKYSEGCGNTCYMSPEYAMGGIFSEKSDVYSFGVLILEIISGRKNTSFYYCEQHLGFLGYGLELVDETLTDSYSSSEVMRCMHIGLLCIQDNAADRPTMPDVVFMLSSETDRRQPKEPIFTFQNPVSGPQPQSEIIFSANEATMSMIQGR
ncbi:S-domain-1 29 [Prunus dulcis]|uniref:S-domain-1 29 n=1 Tax=Prunus dulcis TaxID=3755 RepID=A0A5H2Y5I9_PRUDU|nr:S-domain-1 29 [Prunus dulcis]